MDAGIILVMPTDTPEQVAHRERLRVWARSRAVLFRDEERLIREAVEAGVPQTVVAKEIGRSREYVRLVLRRHEPASA